jgi:hypothetical protein
MLIMKRQTWRRRGQGWLLAGCAFGGVLLQTNGCFPEKFFVGLAQDALNGIGNVLINEVIIDPFREDVSDGVDERRNRDGS